MPKLKTHSGAAKRFKKTGSGGYKHRCTNRNHILTKKATGRKRHLRQDSMVAACDAKLVDQMLAGH